jgi:L,D-transpeptidase catalytic domain
LSKIRIIFVGVFILFTSIWIISFFKKPNTFVASKPTKIVENKIEKIPIPEKKKVNVLVNEDKPEPIRLKSKIVEMPKIDRINQLFATDSSKLPIVETITYTSRVPWLKGRPAWIADYASHYSTSRHFIARSLNHNPDYFTQNVSPGDRFNVIRSDLNLSFYLLADLSRCKMWFYYFDEDAKEKVLLKIYDIGVGRKESKRESKYLTPTGKYQLGSKIAIYKEGTKGYFQDQKIEMIQVFGTRWIPFEKEVHNCTESAKGYGIHGSPWIKDPISGNLIEDRSHIKKYDSDGCIRLNSEDIEELFAITITKPTIIEIVDDYKVADLTDLEKENFPILQPLGRIK